MTRRATIEGKKGNQLKDPTKDLILVAFDGSSTSLRALRRGVDIAEMMGAHLHLMRAIEATYSMNATMHHTLTPLMQEQLRNDTEASLLKATGERLPISQISSEVFIGDIVSETIRVAREKHASMVLVGSHGDVVLSENPPLGHVPTKLIERCTCSVLVVRPPFQIVEDDHAFTPEPPCPHCVKKQERSGIIDATCSVHSNKEPAYESPLRTSPTPGIEQQRQDAWPMW